MNIEELQITDAAVLLADDSLGFAELFRHRVYAQARYGVFLDSFSEGEPMDSVTPLLVSNEVFEDRNIGFGDLIYRKNNLLGIEKTYEVEGYQPEPGGVVRLMLGPSERLFSVPG